MRIAPWTCALALLAGPRGYAADEAPRIALIEDPAETTILPRLRAELSELGLDVRTVAKHPDEQLPRDLIAAARASDSVAAFRIVVEGDRADVWIADRVTGKVVLREMLPRGPRIDGRLVALRAVELLRVSLMELDARRPPPGEVAPPPTLTQTPALMPDLERFSFAAESAFLWSPGGCGPGAGVAAAVAWRPSWLGARLSGGSLLAPATLSRPEGKGEVTTRWLALDAVVQPRRTRMTFRPRGGIGMAALATQLQGLGIEARPSHQATVFTVAPMVSFDLGWAFHPRIRLTVGVAYLRPLRPVDILVAGASVASFGRDILLGSAGVDVVLP